MNTDDHEEALDEDRDVRSLLKHLLAFATHFTDYFHRVQSLAKLKGNVAAEAY